MNYCISSDNHKGIIAVGKIDTPILTIHSFCWHLMRSFSLRLFTNTTNFVPDGLDDDHSKLDDVQSINYGELGIPNFKLSTGELWLSHDDVINLFIHALVDIPNFSKIIKSAIDFILIDEYQDTNGDFLLCLFKKLSSFCVIGLYGDPLQNIYLNDKSINISKIKSTYSIKTIPLSKNYRSQANLVSFFNNVRNPFDKIKQIPQISGTSFPHVFVGNTSLDDNTTALINKKMGFDNSVVLSLTNLLRTRIIGAESIARQLHNGIPGSPRLTWTETLNIDQLNPYLRILLNWSNLYFSHDYQSVQALQYLFTTQSISALSFASIKKCLQNQIKSKNISTAQIIELKLEFKEQIIPLLSWIDSFNYDKLNSVYQFYANLDDLHSQSITIFAAKGLEFDNVILNIDYGHFPHHNWNQINLNHSENDERNIASDVMSYLFYVGITRAKSGLAIYVNKNEHTSFLDNFKNQYPSIGCSNTADISNM